MTSKELHLFCSGFTSSQQVLDEGAQGRRSSSYAGATCWPVEMLTSWPAAVINFHCQDDKSTWTKIESTSSDMVTRFVSIKGEKTDAKDGFRDLPVGESKERVALFLATIPDYFRGRLFYVLGRWKRLFPPGVFNFLMFILQFIMQVMEKIRNKKLEPVCDCKKDCVR